MVTDKNKDAQNENFDELEFDDKKVTENIKSPYPYPFPEEDKKDVNEYPYPYPYPKQESPGPYKFNPQSPGTYPYPVPKDEMYPDYPWPKSLCPKCHSCPVNDKFENTEVAKECIHALKHGCPIFLTFFDEYEAFEELEDVEVFEIGQKFSKYYTQEDLNQIVKNFDELKDIHEPPVAVLGHGETQETLKQSGLPAAGWISSLKVNGNKLIANLKDVPSKIAELIKCGAYKKRSCEIYPSFEFGEKNYGKVLRRVALLGFDIPKIKSLDDILIRYGEKKSSQKIDSVEQDLKFAEQKDYDHNYYFYESKIMKELGIKDPYKIHLAVERSYTGKDLTEEDKEILQVGWPHIHGHQGTPFVNIDDKKYPFPKSTYPYPYPYPFPKSKNFSEEDFEKDNYGRFTIELDKQYLELFSDEAKDWEKRIKRAKEKSGASLLEVYIALGRSQGLWRGLDSSNLGDQDKKILQAGWPEVYGKFGKKFVFRKYYTEDQKPGFSDEQLNKLKDFFQIVEEAEKGNEKIEIDIDTAEIVELFFDVVKRRKEPSKSEQKILQIVWPQYFGIDGEKFKYSEDIEKLAENDEDKKLYNAMINMHFQHAFELIKKGTGIDEISEIYNLYFDAVSGKKKSFDEREQFILQTGWPTIFGKPDTTFIYPKPENLTINIPEIPKPTKLSKLSEGEKMQEDKTKKVDETPIIDVEKFQEMISKVADLTSQLEAKDAAIAERDSKIGDLEKHSEEQEVRISSIEQEAAKNAKKAHLGDIAFFTETLKSKGMAPSFVDEGGLLAYLIGLDWQNRVRFSEDEFAKTPYEKFTEVLEEMVSLQENGKLFVPLKKVKKVDENPSALVEKKADGVDYENLKLQEDIKKYAEENNMTFEEAFNSKNWS